MRSATERCIATSTGIEIGRCYVRKPLARVAGSVSGPHRRPGIAARVLGAMGSMRALFVCIALCAAALLLSACGPSDIEAERATAAAQCRASRWRRLRGYGLRCAFRKPAALSRPVSRHLSGRGLQ